MFRRNNFKTKLLNQFRDKPLLSAVILAASTWVVLFTFFRAPNFGNVPDFTTIDDVKERKTEFFSYLRPIVQYHNDRIREQRALLKDLRDTLAQNGELGWFEQRQLKKLAKRYEYEVDESAMSASIDGLLLRVDVVPTELALVQAAKESGWGRSRYALSAYNLFGQWCYEPGCGIVPKYRPVGMNHEVQKFDSVSSAVHHYINNINTHPFYKKLRQIRSELRSRGEDINGLALANGLHFYSERRGAYVNEVKAMIRQYRYFSEQSKTE